MASMSRDEALELVAEGCARVDEAARFLGIRRALCYRLMQTGELRYLHVGRRRLIPWAELRRFLAERAMAELHGRRA